jgi:GNAT superfamily N-acetyltransferase
VIRPYRPADLPGVTVTFEERYPEELITEAAVEHILTSAPARARAVRLVGEADGEIVAWAGSALVIESERTDVAWVSAFVREPWRGRGLGSELFDRVERHAIGLRARKLVASSRDEERARRFLERRGFRQTYTRRVSTVDPRTVDLSGFSPLRDRLARDGFELVPLSALRDAAEGVYALDIETSRDIPLEEPFAGMPFDEWENEVWRNPLLRFDGSFAVVHRGQPVSFGLVRGAPERSKAFNEMTGTLSQYRGRGLARLVKLATIAWAAEAGIKVLSTENDETNAPMLGLNVSLGYRPSAAHLSWARESP